MKDFFGKDLSVGDFVVIMKPNYRELVLGQIIKFSPKQVRVKWGEEKWDQVSQFPSQVVKIDPNDATMYFLKKTY